MVEKSGIMHYTYHPHHQMLQQALQLHRLMIVQAPARTSVSSGEREPR